MAFVKSQHPRRAVSIDITFMNLYIALYVRYLKVSQERKLEKQLSNCRSDWPARDRQEKRQRNRQVANERS